MSYVSKKTRIFREAGDIEVSLKHSDGRLKSYQSALDPRAWCDSREDRRQYILELIRQGNGKGLSIGKYIPIETIIDILLANKNHEIKKLQFEINRLRKILKDNGLKYKDLEKIEELIAVRELGSISSGEKRRDHINPGATSKTESYPRPNDQEFEDKPTRLNEEKEHRARTSRSPSQKTQDDYGKTKPKDHGTPEDLFAKDQEYASKVGRPSDGRSSKEAPDDHEKTTPKDHGTPVDLFAKDQKYAFQVGRPSDQKHLLSADQTYPATSNTKEFEEDSTSSRRKFEDQEESASKPKRDVTNEEVPSSQRDVFDDQQQKLSDEATKSSEKKTLESKTISQERVTTKIKDQEDKKIMPESQEHSSAAKSSDRKSSESKTISPEDTAKSAISKNKNSLNLDGATSNEQAPKPSKFSDKEPIKSEDYKDRTSEASRPKDQNQIEATLKHQPSARPSDLEALEVKTKPVESKDDESVPKILKPHESAAGSTKQHDQEFLDHKSSQKQEPPVVSKPSTQKLLESHTRSQERTSELNAETLNVLSQEHASKTVRLEDQERTIRTSAPQDDITKTAKSSDQKSVNPKTSSPTSEEKHDTQKPSGQESTEKNLDHFSNRTKDVPEAQQPPSLKTTTPAPDKTKEQPAKAATDYLVSSDQTKEFGSPSAKETTSAVDQKKSDKAIAREVVESSPAAAGKESDHLFPIDKTSEKKLAQKVGIATAVAETESDYLTSSDGMEKQKYLPSGAKMLSTSEASKKESGGLLPADQTKDKKLVQETVQPSSSRFTPSAASRKESGFLLSSDKLAQEAVDQPSMKLSGLEGIITRKDKTVEQDKRIEVLSETEIADIRSSSFEAKKKIPKEPVDTRTMPTDHIDEMSISDHRLVSDPYESILTQDWKDRLLPEDELKELLKEQEDIRRSQHNLAREAIEMLEAIQDIVEDFPSPIPHSSSHLSSDTSDECRNDIENLENAIAEMQLEDSHPDDIMRKEMEILKKNCIQLSEMKKENLELKKEKDLLKSALVKEADDSFEIKLVEFEKIVHERDRLKARIDQLEQQLPSRSRTPFDPDLTPDDNQLRTRLNQLQQLPEEVKALKNRTNEQLQASGDTEEKNKLLRRISELEQEIDNLKFQLKELELLRIERNCCQARLNDLKKVQCNYQDLLERTRGFETLQAECASYRKKCEKLSDLEAECLALREENQKAALLEAERQNLLKELQECMCSMRFQEEEIGRLGSHIDSLTENLDQRQDEMKHKILIMRAKIGKKDVLIARSEQQLEEVQEKLQESIENVSCEKTCLRNRIEDLEDQISQYEKVDSCQTQCLRNRVEELEEQLILQNKTISKFQSENQEENLQKLQAEVFDVTQKCKFLEKELEKNKQKMGDMADQNKYLLDQLETEKRKNEELEKDLEALNSDEHLKTLLEKKKCALKCITNALNKLDLLGAGRFEAEKKKYHQIISDMKKKMSLEVENNNRIKDLEKKLKESQQRSEELKDHLKNVQEKQNQLQEEALIDHSLKSKKSILQVTEESKKVEELEHELKKAYRKIQHFEENIGKIQKEEKQVKDDSSNDSVKNLQNKLLRTEEQLKRCISTNKILKDKLTQQHREIEQPKELIKQTAEELKHQKKEEKHLQLEEELGKNPANQLQYSSEDIKTLKAENDNLKTLMNHLQESSKNQTKQLRSSNEDQLQKLQKLDEENEKLKDELLEKNMLLEELQKQVFYLKQHKTIELKTEESEEIAVYKAENSSLNNELEKLKAELKNQRKACDELIEKLKLKLSDINGIEEKTKAIADEKEEMILTMEKLMRENEILKTQMNSFKGDESSKVNQLRKNLEEIDEKNINCEANEKLLKKENNKLEEERKSLKEENKILSQQLDENKERNKALEEEFEAFKKNLRNEFLQRSKEEMKVNISKTKDLENKISSKTSQINTLNDQIDVLEKEILNKNNEIKSVKSINNNIEQEMNSKNYEITNLKNKIVVLEDDISLKKNKNKDLKDTINNLEKEISLKSNEVKSLKELSNKQKHDFNQIQSELQKYKLDSDEIAKKEEIYLQEKEDLLNQIGSHKSEIADLLKKINSAISEEDAVAKQIENKNEEIQKMRNTINEMENKLKIIENKASKDISDLENKMADIEEKSNEQIEIKNKEIQKMRDDLDTKLKTTDRNKKIISDLQNQIVDLQNKSATQIEEKNKEIETIQNTIDDLQKKLKAADRSKIISDLESRIHNLQKKSIEDIEAKNAEIQKLQDLIAEQDKKLKEISDLERKIQDFQDKSDAKDKDGQKMLNHINDLETRIREIQEKSNVDLKAKDAEIERLLSIITELEKKIKSLDKSQLISDLERKIQDLEDKSDTKEKDCQKMVKIINDLESKLKISDKSTIISDLETRIRDIQEKSNADLEAKNAENQELLNIIADIKKKSKTIDKSKEISDLEKTIQDLQAKSNTKDTDNQKLLNTISDLESKLKHSDKSKTISDLENTIEELKNKFKADLDNKNKEIQKLKTSDQSEIVSDLENKLMKSKAENQKTQEANNALEKELKEKDIIKPPSDLEQIIRDLREKARTEEQKKIAEIQEMQLIINNLEKKLKVSDKSMNELEEKLKLEEQRKIEIQKMQDALDQDNLKPLADLEKTTHSTVPPKPEIINNLQKTSSDLDKIVSELQEKLKSEEKQRQKCQEQAKKLEESLKETQKANEKLKKKIAEPVITNAGDYEKKIDDLEEKLAKSKKECNEIIANLNMQYDRDIKNLQKQNEIAIDKLQKTHNESLVELTTHHSSLLNSLKKELIDKEKLIKKQSKQDAARKDHPLDQIPSITKTKESDRTSKKPLDTKKEKDILSKSEEDQETLRVVPEAKQKLDDKSERSRPESFKKPSKTKEDLIKPDSIDVSPAKPSKFSPFLSKDKKEIAVPATTVDTLRVVPEGKQKLDDKSERSRPESFKKPRKTKEDLIKPDSIDVSPAKPSEFSPFLGKNKKEIAVPATNVCVCGKFPTMVPLEVPVKGNEMEIPRKIPIGLSEIDQTVSLRKIMAIEDKLLAKQEETKTKIETLQTSVERFKKELEGEKEKNKDLLNRYTNQTKTVENMRIEINFCKHKHLHDKKKIDNLNFTLSNFFRGKTGKSCSCAQKRSIRVIPHFHTEIVPMENDNRYKHTCVMRRTPSGCDVGKKTDSFEIDE